MSLPLKPCLRIRKACEFKQVYRSAKRIRLGELTILVRKTMHGHPRVGFALQKKHVKKAVVRNRIRRVMRDSFRQTCEKLPSVDIVVLSNHGLSELDNNSIRQKIEEVWEKLSK